MTLIVQKYGGSSLANLDLIKNVANRVKEEIDRNHQVVVVVSAMFGITDKLVEQCHKLCPLYDPQEYDMVVSTGEQVSAGLLSIALQNLGLKARSFAGWQIPFKTDGAHTKAEIQEVEVSNIQKCIKEGVVCVITGFQGVYDHHVTTLGRGGSDTSAVALAAALKAEQCDIYTDVEGVYTADPRIVSDARKLDYISYDDMVELASLGAKVLQTRSVEMAMKHEVKVRVLSSFTENKGTCVCKGDQIVEKEKITGITSSKDCVKISLMRIPDRPGVGAIIFRLLAEKNINADMISQSFDKVSGKSDIVFTIPKEDFDQARYVLEQKKAEIGYERFFYNRDVAKISVIGIGVKTHADVIPTMFEKLAEKDINVEMISIMETKMSVLIRQDQADLAVRTLHKAYGLERKQIVFS